MTSKRLSLAEQLAELDQPAPVDLDPEDIHDGGNPMDTNDDIDRSHYVDVGPSTMSRMRDITISDPRYEGVKTSRKALFGLDDDVDAGEENSGSEEDESELDNVHPELDGLVEEDRSGSEESENRLEGSPENPPGEHEPPEKPQAVTAKRKDPGVDPATTNGLAASLIQKRDEDRKKGKAVSKQLAVWNTFLDARIQLQKAVTNVSRLPELTQMTQYLEAEECRESVVQMLEQAAALSEELFELRESYLTDTVEIPPRKRRRLSAPEDSIEDYENYFRDASSATAALEHAYHPYQIQTLSKWSAKIQAVAPSVLLPSNRNAFSSSASNPKSAVEQISDILSSDYNKLVARTRLRRGKGTRIDAEEGSQDREGEPDEDVDVFDDADFYQQLLRDVIEARGDASGLNDGWISLQKQKKAKKKVDTKATKGRKVRYEVHEKLQNFMVPIPPGSEGWGEEQTDELFISLLGKGLEDALGRSRTEGLDNGAELEGDQGGLMNGFRVF